MTRQQLLAVLAGAAMALLLPLMMPATAMAQPDEDDEADETDETDETEKADEPDETDEAEKADDKSAENANCVCPPQDLASRAGSKHVFIGKPVEKNDKPEHKGEAMPANAEYRFEVTEWLKGELPAPILVRTFAVTCSTSFEIGQSYVIFGNRNEYDQMTASYCSGNRVATPEVVSELRSIVAAQTGGKSGSGKNGSGKNGASGKNGSGKNGSGASGKSGGGKSMSKTMLGGIVAGALVLVLLVVVLLRRKRG